MGTSGGPSTHLDDHVADQIAAVEETLARVDEVFGNLSTIDYHDITKSMTSLEKAKYDLTNLYAINSLFWMYLRSFGEDPKNTSIKEELDRIRKQMIRVSEIEKKSKMPRIDKEAANRFVRHELNKPGHKKPVTTVVDEDWDQEPMETDGDKSSPPKAPENGSESSSRKRKREINFSSSSEEDDESSEETEESGEDSDKS